MEELVINYITSAKFRVINSAKVYDEEKIIVIEDGEYYLVLQVHDSKLWSKVLALVKKSLGAVKQIVNELENKRNALLPTSVTFMRLKKKNVKFG